MYPARNYIRSALETVLRGSQTVHANDSPWARFHLPSKIHPLGRPVTCYAN